MILPNKAHLVLAVIFLRLGSLAYGQSATGISGLYYTGANNSGGLLTAGTTDGHWTVSYARVSGAENATYEGAAYVVSGTVGGWTANTSTAQWITAPGAQNSGGTVNAGGASLLGNGTTDGALGNNSAYYVYRLAFTIAGTGAAGTAVTNNVSITMTMAADDQYTVYVNPAAAPTVNGSGVISAGGTAASGSATSAWNNTTALRLANYDPPGAAVKTADFKIGTNYLYVVVANTNSQTGNNASNALNPSGLLVYQVGTAMTIDGNPVVPEVGTWLPVVLALGLFVRKRYVGFLARWPMA
jgi:hypothetical protein